MEHIETLLPLSVNLNASPFDLAPNESSFLKNYTTVSSINRDGEQGANLGQGKKLPSNQLLVNLPLPAGTNKTIFHLEQRILNESYIGIWNSNGQHTIFVIYGYTLNFDMVYQGPDLNFSIDPVNAIKDHRAYLQLIYDVDGDKQRHLRQKILIYTDGNDFQRWIETKASIATKSFSTNYYKVFTPHFDTKELLEYPTRPPMYAPVLTAIPRATNDDGLQSLLLNKVTQMGYRYVLSDGRRTSVSPYSDPFFLVNSACTSNKLLPRSVDVQLYAGCPHVEMIELLARDCTGVWLLYDTIYKYTSDGVNSPDIINDEYWTRTQPWANNNWDPTTNTIHYTYSGDLQATSIDLEDANSFQNDVPIKSMAMTSAGNALIWANNLYGYNNLPTETLNKFDFSVAPATTGQATYQNSKIVVYAAIGRNAETNQVVYINGTDTRVRFGGLQIVDTAQGNVVAIDTVENDKFFLILANGNFVAYLAGTPYTSVGVQYRSDSSGNLTKVGTLNRTNNDDLELIKNTFAAGGFFVQRFEFDVPRGRYIVRLADHGADLTTDYETSSTYVMGVVSHKKIVSPGGFTADLFNSNTSNGADYTKEIQVDATAGDVDTWGMGNDLLYVFVPYIYTNNASFFDLGSAHYRFIMGNVYEDNINNVPVEQLYYYPEQGFTPEMRSGFLTDHNGFFFGYMAGSKANNSEIIFYGYYDCKSYVSLFRTAVNDTAGSSDGFFFGQVIDIANILGVFNLNNRISVKGTVVDCTTGVGIPSIGVTLSNSKTYFTDSNGNFELLVHDGPRSNRVDNIYFNSGGTCLFSACDGSYMAIVPFTSAGLNCKAGVLRSVTAVNVTMKAIVSTGSGPKEGGKYGFGIAISDGSRWGFIQDIQYLDIPSFVETGVFTLSQVQWKVQTPVKLPSFVKYFTIFRTLERTAQKYLQWVGDSITFLDSKGNPVPDGNGAIRAQIIIQSLLDFNISNNFNTNATYQFTPGDIIRIYDDGNGNLLTPAKNNGFMDYQVLGTDYNQTVQGYNQGNVAVNTTSKIIDSQGNVTNETSTAVPAPNQSTAGVSIIIEFDERLLQLSNNTGFWIQLTTPKEITDQDRYVELVGTIPVVNGEPLMSSGNIEFADTFLQTRFIRIPNALGKSLGHPFCSAAITDYWGAGCTNMTGRSLTKNPLAKQVWVQDDAVKTDDTSADGILNGLGRVFEKNRKSFKGQNFGGIVAMRADRNRIVFICTNDSFICDYQLNYLKVTPRGVIQANLDENMSDPYPKEGYTYGCAYEDVSTIVWGDDGVSWLDRNNRMAVIKPNNTMVAIPMGMDEVGSYFLNKLDHLLRFNSALTPDKYLQYLIETSAGIDPVSGQYNLTFRPRRGLDTSPQHFVNDEREIFHDLQETFVYNFKSKKWVHFAGYTPEYYGSLRNTKKGRLLITFAAGQPWMHNVSGTKTANTFYGIKTNTIVELPLNIDSNKVKIFQSIGICTSDVKWFVDSIKTDDPRMFSLIPLSWIKKREYIYYGPFLRNMNSYPDPNHPVASLLMDGGRIYGKKAGVRLVSDPAKMDEYIELNSISYRIIWSEKSEK